MTQAGFEADYGEMRSAAGHLEDCAETLRGSRSFANSADLSRSVQYAFGPSNASPLNILVDEFDNFVNFVYQPTLQRVHDCVNEMAGRFDTLSGNLRQAIAEYENADRSSAGHISQVDPPR